MFKNNSSTGSILWRLGLVSAFLCALFALYPQFKLVYNRGAEWQGNYAYNDIDEVAYASYLRALIDRRPRKNDPYTGRDHTAEDPQPESLFSIQFAAPYSVAIPARILGIGAPWAMTISGAVAAFLAALAIFWVVFLLTGNNWVAFAGSLFVIAGGALAAGEGAIGEILGTGYSYPYFPGLRRYIPAMALPFFFILCGSIWKLFEAHGRKKLLFGLLGILSFGYVTFSYFYIWTTAAAWLASLFLVYLIIRPDGFKNDLKWLAAVGIFCGALLLPYAYLLSQRAESLDHIQLLVETHQPDIFRVPVYIAVFVIVLIAGGALSRIIEFRSRAVIFTVSLAVTVFAVFNQQVITGKELQPIHYQVFIGNYVAALALICAIGILLKDKLAKNPAITKAAITGFALISTMWGLVECHYTVRILDDANVHRDKGMGVARRLSELASGDPDPHRTTVLSFSMTQADDLPTIIPQNVLWARHQHVFAGLSWEESKERYYQYLYYSDVDSASLAERLKDGDFVSMIALFGWGRHTDRLSSAAKPLTIGEIDEESARYQQFIEQFDQKTAANPVVSYVILPVNSNRKLENFNKWYELDEGEPHGDFILHKVTPK